MIIYFWIRFRLGDADALRKVRAERLMGVEHGRLKGRVMCVCVCVCVCVCILCVCVCILCMCVCVCVCV